MAKFKLLLTSPETPPVTLLITAFKCNKERNNEYKKNLIRIKIRKKKRVLTMGIYILYSHEIKCNYVYKRRGKRPY